MSKIYKITSIDGIYEFTLDSDLRGIGTTYDKVVFDRVSHVGYLERRIYKKVFNGTEVIGYNNSTATGATFYHPTSGDVAVLSTSLEAMCNHLTLNGGATTATEGIFRTNYGVLYFRLNNTTIGTISGDSNTTYIAKAKAWLVDRFNNGVPMEYHYILSKPTRTPLTFTKVTSSTKTEVPMAFLTNTPSLDYPASVLSVESGSKVAIHGKNLYDVDNNPLTFNQMIQPNGSISYSPSRYACFNYLKVKPNTTYKLSGLSTSTSYSNILVAKYNSNNGFVGNMGGYIGVKSGTRGGLTFTTETNAEYIRFSFESFDATTFQLEDGATATAYEPFKGYQETTIPVTLKSIG